MDRRHPRALAELRQAPGKAPPGGHPRCRTGQVSLDAGGIARLPVRPGTEDTLSCFSEAAAQPVGESEAVEGTARLAATTPDAGRVSDWTTPSHRCPGMGRGGSCFPRV